MSNTDGFDTIARHIKVNNQDLQSWIDDINFKLSIVGTTATYSGICHDDSDIIPIPQEVQNLAVAPNRPYLFKNSKLIDLALVSFVEPCPTTIQLTGDAILSDGDYFVVFIKP